MTLLPSPLHLAAAAAERVQPTAPGSSPGSSKGLANTGIAAVKMPSEVQLLEQAALLMRALTRNDPFVMVLVATADKAWLDGREDRSPPRECAPCGCHHAAGRSSGFAAAGSLNPGRRCRNRPTAPTAGPARRICLTSHQLTAAVAVDGDTTVPDLQASARHGRSASRRGRRLVYRVLHGPVLPVWRGMGSRPRRALSRLGGVAVVTGYVEADGRAPMMVPLMLPVIPTALKWAAGMAGLV